MDMAMMITTIDWSFNFPSGINSGKMERHCLAYTPAFQNAVAMFGFDLSNGMTTFEIVTFCDCLNAVCSFTWAICFVRCEIIDRTWWFLNWFEFLEPRKRLCFWEQGETELNEFEERVSKLFERRGVNHIFVVVVFVFNYTSPFCLSIIYQLFKTHKHILKESYSWKIFLRLKGHVKCLIFPILTIWNVHMAIEYVASEMDVESVVCN